MLPMEMLHILVLLANRESSLMSVAFFPINAGRVGMLVEKDGGESIRCVDGKRKSHQSCANAF